MCCCTPGFDLFELRVVYIEFKISYSNGSSVGRLPLWIKAIEGVLYPSKKDEGGGDWSFCGYTTVFATFCYISTVLLF